MTLSWPYKDPNEKLDYSLDWSARLGVDSISASTWVDLSSNGIVIESTSYTTSITTIWYSAGTIGISYYITNRITDGSGRIMDQTVKIKIKAR